MTVKCKNVRPNKKFPLSVSLSARTYPVYIAHSSIKIQGH